MSQFDHREQWTIRRSTVDTAAYYSGFAFPANKYNLISLKMFLPALRAHGDDVICTTRAQVFVTNNIHHLKKQGSLENG